MKPSFEGCRYRWDAAAEDFYELSLDMRRTLDLYGDPIRVGSQGDPKGNAMFAVITDVMPVPGSWGRRIGHITYDLRSTLDHVVHQLYIASNGRAPTGQAARKLAFPICHWYGNKRGRPEGFKSYAPRVLGGIDPRFVKIIRQHQPYRARPRRLHALAILESLSNLDKHRDDHVLLFGAHDFHIAAIPINATLRGIEQLTDLRRPLKVGTKVARIVFVPSAPQYGAKMKRAGRVEPAFRNGLFVMETLRAIFTEVGFVVKRCADAVGPDMWAPIQTVEPRRRRLRGILAKYPVSDADRAALDALGR